jgi:hypothetical protein
MFWSGGQQPINRKANTEGEFAIRFQEAKMKRTISMWAAAFVFVGTLALASAHATNSAQAMYKKPVEVTGCLQQGPVAKEYLVRASDGTTWGINETDLLINDYVGQTITVVGDAIWPTTAEGVSGGAQHYLRAMDLVVDSESCQR